MRILFLHPNFAAQFKETCTSLVNELEHEVFFLCQTHYGRNIPGVQKLVLKGRGSNEMTLKHSTTEHGRSLYRSTVYKEAFISLKKNNWSPEVVVSHCGWGCGIYVKDIWPESRFIAYLEWWFSPSSELQKRLQINQYYQLSSATNDKLTIRNLTACYEMTMADDIVCPTEWQRQQLPKRLREHCRVIRDQVDRTIFFPDPDKQSVTPMLTYGTRGMEPMRGFPEFIKSLPRVLQKWPQLRAEIAGIDSVNYGGAMPPQGSWKKWAEELLEQNNLMNRVSWKGQLPLQAYTNWLKSSWCHVYLSEPFVTSWSLIEACHCAIPMVATRGKATDEFSHLNPFLLQVEHNNEDELVEAINNRIRFSSNFSRAAFKDKHCRQAKSVDFSLITLASYVTDVESATGN